MSGGYRFPKIVRRGGRLIVIKSLKIRISTMPRDKGFRKSLRDELMRDNLYANHWVDAVIITAYSMLT